LPIEIAATLLERDRELDELGSALAGAQDGSGRIIIVEAPAGLGKSSLLAAASETAVEAGITCLRARATELERDFAYGCVRQLLEPAVATASGAERERLFEGAAALAEGVFGPSGPEGASPSASSAFSMLHGLYWLFSNVADQGPLAVVVDDIHWSDAQSLRFLTYLAPRLSGLPVAVLASTRSGESITDDVVRLAAAPETTVVRPRPLSTGATATLCKRALGPDVSPEFAAASREATGGNPFFLEALLREAVEQGFSTDAHGAARVRASGPPAVAQAVLLRLSGAPDAATKLVRAGAVLGDGASVGEAARLAGLSEDEAARGADLLTTLALLRPADRLEFAHPIVREAVYADIGPRHRAEAHALAAGILASTGASEERIAAQIAKSEPTGDPHSVELLRRVAADALVRGAPAGAVAWLRRALAEPPPETLMAEVLLELGTAELRRGDSESVGHLEAAFELTREPRPLAIAARQLANALSMSGDADRAVEVIESAVARVEPQDRELGLLLEAELAAKAQQADFEARAPAAARLERHADLAGHTPGERLVLASLAFERARASESATEAAAHIERALAGGRLLGEQEIDVAGPFYALAVGLLATDALQLARSCLNEALADADARGSIPAMGYVIAHRGWASMRQGAVGDAEADARTAYELLTAHDIRLGSAFALALLVEALMEAGELDEARRSFDAGELGDEIPPGLATNDLLQALGMLHLAERDPRAAADDLIEFGRRDELWGAANPLASRWRSRAALALAAAGDVDEARRVAAEDLERARRWGAASGIGVALRAVALVDSDSARIDRLSAAVEVLERSPARLEHARALVDLGAALRRANSRADARSVLQQGLDLAARCRARALVTRARTELRAAGGPTADPYANGLAQLTASERRVAELAAEGRSNPEIAQALFVTRKTVETHLGRVYRKLDIPGRGKLARALDESS
jgi:DNA-binding CsgD family transcriptional regulator